MKAKLMQLIILCSVISFMFACGGTGERVQNVFEKLFGAQKQRSVTLQRISIDEYNNKIRGAWAGQMVGLSYASALEFQALGDIYRGEIPSYDPEEIAIALEKEDLYVAMTIMQSLRNNTFSTDAKDVAELLVKTDYPLRLANFRSRENLLSGIAPNRAGHPSVNPHAFSVSFQNEAALFGIVSPGMYLTSVAIANQVGPLLAYDEGIDGGKYITALYSSVFFETQPDVIVENALETLSVGSPYSQLIQDVLTFYRSNPDDWKACWDMLEQRWARRERSQEGMDSPLNVDAKFNGGYITLGLLYGYGDFERTLELTARCGQDADSNTAHAAGILGGILGYRRIPSEYTIGLALIQDQNFLSSDYTYNSLISETQGIAEDLIRLYGGRVENLGDRDYYMVPIQPRREVY